LQEKKTGKIKTLFGTRFAIAILAVCLAQDLQCLPFWQKMRDSCHFGSWSAIWCFGTGFATAVLADYPAGLGATPLTGGVKR
jgi:hypothetical protein